MPIPIPIERVSSVTLNVYCKTVSGGGGTYNLRSDIGPNNWGLSLGASAPEYAAKWLSTATTLEDEQTVNATGWYVFPIDKNLVNWDGQIWLRMADQDELILEIKSVAFATQDDANPALRPFIRVEVTPLPDPDTAGPIHFDAKPLETAFSSSRGGEFESRRELTHTPIKLTTYKIKRLIFFSSSREVNFISKP